RLTNLWSTGEVRGHINGLTFLGALVFAFVVRGPVAVGFALLFVVFVPLEKLFALRPQRVFRSGLLTDLTHILVNAALTGIGVVALVVVAAIPLLWIGHLELVSALPGWAAVALAVALVAVANYCGHRLTHQVPFLWRFHSVHHSIEQMDW